MARDATLSVINATVVAMTDADLFVDGRIVSGTLDGVLASGTSEIVIGTGGGIVSAKSSAITIGGGGVILNHGELLSSDSSAIRVSSSGSLLVVNTGSDLAVCEPCADAIFVTSDISFTLDNSGTIVGWVRALSSSTVFKLDQQRHDHRRRLRVELGRTGLILEFRAYLR